MTDEQEHIGSVAMGDSREAEAIGWPKIMYVCERCYENAPEMCGKDRHDISVMPDGRWICNDCLHEEYDGETLLPDAPLLYAALSRPVQEPVAFSATASYVAEFGVPRWAASPLTDLRKFVDLIEGRAMACDGPVTPFLDELAAASEPEKDRFVAILRQIYSLGEPTR